MARRRAASRLKKLAARVRTTTGGVLVVVAVTHPVRLSSVRWWRVPEIAASLRLTALQRDAFDHAYERRLPARRHCVERAVEASNRVDALLRNGVYDQHVLEETQAVAVAASDERALTRALSDELVALLTPAQRQALANMRPRPSAE